MKRLFLLRHGCAPPKFGASDFGRTLNSEGLRECEEVGEFISKLPYRIDLVKSSDAKRTRQTCEEIIRHLEYKIPQQFSAELYNASSEDILSNIQATSSDIKNLMVIGHNPGISSIVPLLSPANLRNHLYDVNNFEATCKLVILQLNVTEWNEISDDETFIESTFIPQGIKKQVFVERS